MPNKPKSAAIWNPFTAKSRADRSAQEMYPGKIGQDDQRDAARHMLASGYLAKAWSPGVADLIGKAHEFKETPFRHLGALAGVAQHRYDRPIDLHNNTLGIELAQKAGSMEEFERLVNEAAERARPTQTPGAPWVPSAKDAAEMRKGSAQYAKGGSVATFQDGGAAFGVFPQMRPKRTRQDPEAAKDVPLALARGAVSGVLGAPGDIESLVRMLPGLDESRTVLPTSEDVQRRLPMPELAATPVGKAATNVGALAGGFYTGPGAPLRLAASVPGALKHGATEFAKAAGQPAVNVVKPEGGDWLKGAVQRGVSGLKKYDLPDLFPELGGGPPPNTPANEAINKWIGSNLGNYLQKQMATPSDPVRKLAEEGITHIPDLANRTASFPTGTLRRERGRADFPEFGMGQSELAKKWENLADESIVTHRAGDIQRVMNMQPELEAAKEAYQEAISRVGRGFDERLRSTPGFSEKDIATLNEKTPVWDKARILGDTEFEDVLQAHHRLQSEATGVKKMIGDENPWIAKLDPEAPAYHGDVYDLGFDHVVDVLGEMVASGRIRPEQLNKVSLEQAIRMTHQYDIEMAEKAAKAATVAREGLPVYKEYPEGGMRWIELNRPGSFASESDAMGHSVRGYEPPKGHPDWVEGSGDAGHLGYGHGGWDAIKSGKAKVYSLVDGKGKPHVTVEVRANNTASASDFKNAGLDYNEAMLEAKRRMGITPENEKEWVRSSGSEQRAQASKDLYKHIDDIFKERTGGSPQEITQIKGKSNRAPNPEYLPFVQDFVKSGQWSGVGDMGNTGLRDVQSWVDPGTMAEYRKLGLDVPKYATRDELDKLHSLYESRATPPQGYNKGGTVKTGIKEGVDLARRSFFGLRPSQDMAGRELVPVQKDLDRMQAELAKAEKVAPKVEQKTTTVQPSPTAPKIEQTVKSIAETPVSRRTVLKSAAGQAIQGALPASSFADLMKPATVAKQAVQAMAPAAAPTASMVPGLMAQAIKKGMDMDEAMSYVKSQLGKHGDDVFHESTSGVVYDTLKNPFESIVDDPDWLYVLNKSGERERMKGPGELLQSQLSTGTAPGSLKEILRGVKPEMAPGDYANMKNAVRDAIYYADKYGDEP
jgi:hypothetical protein